MHSFDATEAAYKNGFHAGAIAMLNMLFTFISRNATQCPNGKCRVLNSDEFENALDRFFEETIR